MPKRSDPHGTITEADKNVHSDVGFCWESERVKRGQEVCPSEGSSLLDSSASAEHFYVCGD